RRSGKMAIHVLMEETGYRGRILASMSLSFWVDRVMFSRAIAPQSNTRVAERIPASRDGCATAAPVVHEIRCGILLLPPTRRRIELERSYTETTAWLPVLGYDTTLAEWRAAAWARLVGLGRTPPFLDGQISAIAAANNLMVVTANIAGCRYFHGLLLEDWRA